MRRVHLSGAPQMGYRERPDLQTVLEEVSAKIDAVS